MPVYDTHATTRARSTSRETADTRLVDWAAARDIHDAVARPDIPVDFTAPTEPEPCGACPDAQTGGPNTAEAVLIHRRPGSAWTYRTPVARCCAGAEIRQLRAHPLGLDELRIEIPTPTFRAA